jgi:hypothetical protein
LINESKSWKKLWTNVRSHNSTLIRNKKKKHIEWKQGSEKKNKKMQIKKTEMTTAKDTNIETKSRKGKMYSKKHKQEK